MHVHMYIGFCERFYKGAETKGRIGGREEFMFLPGLR